MRKDNIKTILISYHGFNLDAIKTLKDKKTLKILDLKKLNSVFFQKAEEIIAGTWNIQDKQFKIFLELAFCFSKAKKKYFIDNQSRKESFSYFKFIFIDIPIFILEINFDLLLVIFSWLGLLIFNFWPKRKCKGLLRSDKLGLTITEKNRIRDNGKIIYLRTDNFKGLQQGGSFTHFRGIVTAFYKLGYQIYYLGAGIIEVPKIDLAKTIINYPLKFNLPEIPDIYYNWRFIPKALKIIKTKQPLFLYQRHSIFNVCGAVLSQLTGIPLILEYNGSEPWVREKWGGLLIFKRLCYFMENTTLKKADLITVVSKPMKDELLKRKIPEEKILVNYNGVDIDEFNPKIDGSEIRKKYNLENKIVIGAVSTFGVWHGMPILSQAVKPIINKIQNTQYKIHFLFIGDGVERIKCENIIKESGMSGYVTFTGTISFTEIPKYLAACDILVAPHIPNSDGTPFFGSPTKLFEYMAMGKGIVASNLNQIGEVLEHKKTALLVKPGDVNDLTCGIIKLIKDKKLREELGRNARDEVINKYTWEKNVKRVIDIYEKFD